MSKQQYSNHSKYYYPHHFIFYPIIIAGMIFCLREAYHSPDHFYAWVSIAFIFALLGWLSFMMRQHYALTLQNRLVRMELRLRYFQLTQKRLDDIEDRISFAQLAALRFAPDNELPALVQRTMDDHLSADEIKKAIKNWLPDTMRV